MRRVKGLPMINDWEWRDVRHIVVSVLQSAETLAPDLLFLDPLVFSCVSLKALGVRSAPINPSKCVGSG